MNLNKFKPSITSATVRDEKLFFLELSAHDADIYMNAKMNAGDPQKKAELDGAAQEILRKNWVAKDGQQLFSTVEAMESSISFSAMLDVSKAFIESNTPRSAVNPPNAARG